MGYKRPMRRLLTIAAAVGFFVFSGRALALWQSNTFHSPTGNIHCRYFQNTPGKKLACLSVNNNRLVVATPTGRSYVTTSSVYYYPAGHILPYGQTWRVRGVYRCVSRVSGMTCKAVQTGHGFFINRSSYQVF